MGCRKSYPDLNLNNLSKALQFLLFHSLVYQPDHGFPLLFLDFQSTAACSPD